MSRYTLVWIGILALGIIVGSRLSPPIEQPQNTQQYQSATQNTERNSPLPNLRRSEENKEQEPKVTKHKWYEDPQWITTTIILSIYTAATILYAIFAAFQWIAIRAQVPRPYVTLDRLRIKHMGAFEEDPTLACFAIILVLGNHGSTPGWPDKIAVHAKVDKSAHLEGQKPPDYRQSIWGALGGILPQGQAHEWEHSNAPQLCVRKDEMAQVTSGDMNLFFFGSIRYLDGRNDPHDTCFAIRYAPKHPGEYFVVNNVGFWKHT